MLHRRQSGFSIVAAIFILVVLAALGGFIVTVSSTQHVGMALDVQGARAYQAARAGIEWGVYTVLVNDPSAAANRVRCNTSRYDRPASFDLNIEGFGVTVTCGSARFTDGDDIRIYKITATACAPTAGACPNAGAVGTLPYVERRITITVENSGSMI